MPVPAGWSPEAGGHRGVLMVCDEWLPRHGGLSRFNKDLAAALAGHGHDVSCVAAGPLRADYQDARAHGVRLVVAEGPDLTGLGPHMLSHQVDLVVGHARPAFAEALTQARQHFHGSALAVVVHTIPEQIAPFRQGADLPTAARDAASRTRQVLAMCDEADLVYGVGPRLARYWQDQLGTTARVHELVPGLGTTSPVTHTHLVHANRTGGHDLAHTTVDHVPQITPGPEPTTATQTPQPPATDHEAPSVTDRLARLDAQLAARAQQRPDRSFAIQPGPPPPRLQI